MENESSRLIGTFYLVPAHTFFKQERWLEDKRLEQQEQQPQQQLPSQQKKQRWINDEINFQISDLISAGLLAVFLVILQAFIGLGLCTVWSYIVVISLAISAPCLAGRLIIKVHEQKYRYRQSSLIVNTLYAFGIFSGFVGLVATFWYMSTVTGIVFLVVSLVVGVFSFLDLSNLSLDEEGKHKNH